VIAYSCSLSDCTYVQTAVNTLSVSLLALFLPFLGAAGSR